MVNNGFPDMHIYVLQSGQSRSLGMATGLSETTLTLPRQIVESLREIQILADPIGASRPYVTPFLLAYPGERIRLTIQNVLSLSTAWVEDRYETEGTGVVSYPHAFPREGVTKVLENDRVVIWDSFWPSGVEQQLHEHKYDLAGVILQWGPLRLTDPDGTVRESTEPFQVPRPFYEAKGVTHIEEGIGPPVRHAISIDLKEERPPELLARTDIPSAFPGEPANALIENPRVTPWDYTWQPGQRGPLHFHDKDAVVVFLNSEPGTLLLTNEDGSEERITASHGDVRFWPRGRAHTEEAVDGSLRAMIIELN